MNLVRHNLLPLTLLISTFLGIPSSAQQTVAIINVNVLPMTNEQVLPSETVIVKAGRIAFVGPSTAARIPNDALRIDGRGKYLIPGLCDMHVHVYYAEELIPYVANGVTTIANMRGAPYHLEWRHKIESGEMLGPTLYTAGPTLDGKPPLNRRSIVIVSPEEAATEVSRQRRLGYDYIKVYNNIPSDAYAALLATAKAEHIPVVGHWVRSAGPTLLGRGQAEVAHLEEFYYGFFNSQPDESRLEEAAKQTVANGVAVATTLTAIRNISKLPAGTDAFLAAPNTKYLPPPVLGQWSENPFRGQSQDFVDKNDRMYHFLKRIALTMQRRHAKLLLGTDSSFVTLVGGFAVHDELEVLVGSGLTPYEALVTATRAPGEFVAETLGRGPGFGTIEVGKRADLVLLDANPLDDISNTRKRVGVLLRGKWFPQRELNTIMDDTAASFVGWR